MKQDEIMEHTKKFCQDVTRKDLLANLQAFVEQSTKDQEMLLQNLGLQPPVVHSVGWELTVDGLFYDHWKMTFESLFRDYKWCPFFLQHETLSSILAHLSSCEEAIHQGYEKKEARAQKIQNLPTHWSNLDGSQKHQVEEFIIHYMNQCKENVDSPISLLVEGVNKLKRRELAVNIFTGALRSSWYDSFFESNRRKHTKDTPYLPAAFKAYPRDKMISLLSSIVDEIRLRAGRGKVLRWQNEENCSFRVVAETGERVAFIEKTPRIYVGGEWVSGHRGCGGCMEEVHRRDGTVSLQGDCYGQYEPSRAWCDTELLKLGWELEGRVYSS
jgi:hypothetical protein